MTPRWPTFRHEAMATYFEVVIAGHPADYARHAATALFREVDRLENELSRFVETSDIARANRIRRGETIAIGDDAIECLLLAADVALATNHAFDAAYGSLRDAAADSVAGAAAGTASSPVSDPSAASVRSVPPSDKPLFTLDPSAHTLTSHAARLDLDLGAIGKGYALDVAAAVLGDWAITTACLNSGGSTALALGAPADEAGWPIALGEGDQPPLLALRDAALSGSGTAVKGLHLIDPRARRPAAREHRAWALADTAALSDALSTAFFVMTDEEIAAFCADHATIGAALADGRGGLVRYGRLRTEG